MATKQAKEQENTKRLKESQRSIEDSDGLDDISEIFTLLGNPMRRGILRRLALGPDYLFSLQKKLGTTAANLIKHLKQLKESGVIDRIDSQEEIDEEELIASFSTVDHESRAGPARAYYRLRRHVNFLISLDESGLHVQDLSEHQREVTDQQGESHLRKLTRIPRTPPSIKNQDSKDLDDLEKFTKYANSLRESFSGQVDTFNAILDKFRETEERMRELELEFEQLQSGRHQILSELRQDLINRDSLLPELRYFLYDLVTRTDWNADEIRALLQYITFDEIICLLGLIVNELGIKLDIDFVGSRIFQCIENKRADEADSSTGKSSGGATKYKPRKSKSAGKRDSLRRAK